MTRLRVLIVEDHEPDAELLVRELKRIGYDLAWAVVSHDRELIEQLHRDWDVMLCDHELPGSSVATILQAIRCVGVDLPVIVLSGVVPEEVAVEAMRAGARDFIVKGTWSRLGPAIARELAEARGRRARRELEARLDHAAKEEVLGRLAAGIAHDVNNLLTVISGNAEFAARLATTGRMPSDALRRIEEAVRQGGALTRRLLAYVRRDGQPDPAPRPTEPAAIITAAAELLPILVSDVIRLEIRFEPSVPKVLVDPDRACQAILNLALNARDAMPTGGVLTIIAARHGDGAAIIVGDTGTGMTGDVMAQLFAPFFTTKPIGKGTGLGLAMCKSFARDAGGRIDIESEPGQGTRVAIELPAAPTQRMIATARPAAPFGAPIAVIAEGDRGVRELVGAALSDALGTTEVLAAEGEAAVAAALEHLASLRLLVIDADISGLDAREVIRRVRCQRPDTAIILMVASVDVAGAPVDDRLRLLPKPFVARDLVERLASLGLVDGAANRQANAKPTGAGEA